QTTPAQQIPAQTVENMDEPSTKAEVAPAMVTNGKRKAEDELDSGREKSSAPADIRSDENETVTNQAGNDNGSQGDGSAPTLSKNQLRKQRKQQAYEVYKEQRKEKRKDKRHDKQARKRAEREATIAAAQAAGIDPATVLPPKKEPWRPRPVPVAIIIDCDFEEYMRENEIVSLSSQIVRSYSQNRRSKFQAHLVVSSWKGKLKTRFETVLKNAHDRWINVHVMEGDFVEAAKFAKEKLLTGPGAGDVNDLVKPSEKDVEEVAQSNSEAAPVPEAESDNVDQSIVYLSSESPYTLDRLEPNTSYVIGGLVDRNREKGLCYKRALQHKVRTAKLPIGEYMAMQSRYVLTTNQVVEIMARWLECGDWGEAFMNVIPKRKGGTLKTQGSSVADADELDNGDDVEQEDEG
ncbi:guanine-1-methyltransferase-domain-containing protein, partial [Bombardia bombarda]